MLQRSIVPACLLLSCWLTGTAAAQLQSPMISEIEAQKRGLTRAWYAQVPVDRTRDRVENITLHDGTLFAQSGRGTITALDGETGERIWSTSVGKPDHPTTAVGANRRYVAVLNGSTLYVMFRNNGKIFWERQVKGSPGAGPGITEDHVFVPMINGMVEGYELEDYRHPPWIYNSSGRAVVQPVVTEQSVGWPTDRGLFYVAGAQKLGVKFRVEAVESIVCQAGFAAPHLYVASLDGYLYKVHERSGSMVWRYSTGRPISKTPLAVENAVYVTAERNGLFSVDSETSDENWWTPRIEQVLAVSPGRVYGIDSSKRLNIMRVDTGAVLSKLDLNGLDIVLTNSENDRLYLANKYGVVQCLREIELVEPVVHGGPSKAEEEKPEVKQQGLEDALAQPEKEKPKEPAAGNPFGDNDPFGGGGPTKDPFGGGGDEAPAEGGANPFGGGADPFGGGGADPFGAPAAGGGAAPADDNDPFGAGKDPFGGG